MGRDPQRLLGFFPHPDDESWAAGGTLARCAAQKVRVDLMCATRGEAGLDLQCPTCSKAALASKRTNELAQACRILGIQPPLFLDLPDGRVTESLNETVIDDLAGRLLSVRPAVLLSFGPDGGYGHVDHIACTDLLSQALDRLVGQFEPRWLQVVFPKGLLAPVWRMLNRHEGVGLVAADLDPERLGQAPSDVQLKVDIRPVRQVKRAALQAHRSQLPGEETGRFLYPGFIDHLLDEEWFCLARGPALPPGATDPLAGL